MARPMTPRERVLCTLRGGQADRVPYDITHCSNGLGGFNREAARLFRGRTGSDNPDEYCKPPSIGLGSRKRSPACPIGDSNWPY